MFHFSHLVVVIPLVTREGLLGPTISTKMTQLLTGEQCGNGKRNIGGNIYRGILVTPGNCPISSLLAGTFESMMMMMMIFRLSLWVGYFSIFLEGILSRHHVTAVTEPWRFPPQGNFTRTTAEPRVNAYIPDDEHGLPKVLWETGALVS